ncbi:hypothetical protein KJZ61_02335 [Candidatus Dependentiae bacterium]|nr:hypothetical protein [Candidatus Dependentiae bacterium]
MAIKTLAHFSPGRTILTSVFIAIMSGTFLLALPIARTTSIPFIDLFFTATSATCVTGLFTIPLDQFTTFGHAVILLLIQIGGLGLITMTLFFMSLFLNLGLTTQFMAGQLLEIDSLHHLRNIIFFIIRLTLCTELIGACFVFWAIRADFPFVQACFFALFHAISSFCNAGISIFPTELIHYKTNLVMLHTTMWLIFCGGLGFITWREIIINLGAWLRNKRIIFSLQSKLIVLGTLVSVIFTAALFWILEHDNAFAGLDFITSWTNALFHSIAMRSTGFVTVTIDQLQLASLLLIMILTFIGSAPGSTGSGIKITNFILILATIKAGLSNKQAVEIKGRRIPRDQIHKAVTIVALSIFWILISLFLLLITEEKMHFIELTLEAVTAFTNLGLSTGVTSRLSMIGKLFIILSMIAGRIGSLTLILALRKTKASTVEFSYPEERVMLG